MKNQTPPDNNDKGFSPNEEIDLRLVFKFFFRNKLLIGSFGVIFFVLGFLYSLTLRRTWQGEFQIVLSNEKPTSNILNPIYQQVLNEPASNLKTQVGILKSPSVLMPIFQFIVKEKNLSNDYTFKQWDDNLNINLDKGTSILNISYKDTNRELIIPALQKISLTFQDYSGKNRIRNQTLTKNYLNEQIAFFKSKSSKSLKIAQEYAIDQDLAFPGSNLGKSFSPSNNKLDFLIPNIGIENVRVQAAAEIRNIDALLQKIEEAGEDYEKLEYIGSNIQQISEEGLPGQLALLDRKIISTKLKYTENDVSVRKLKEERDLLVRLLKKRTIGYLKAKKLEAIAKNESALRPKGVLLKYKEYIREAQRDEITLINLENNLRQFELEQAKLNDPWELITNPTLIKEPVGPSRKKFAIYGFIMGVLVGSGIASYNQSKLIKQDAN